MTVVKKTRAAVTAGEAARPKRARRATPAAERPKAAATSEANAPRRTGAALPELSPERLEGLHGPFPLASPDLFASRSKPWILQFSPMRDGGAPIKKAPGQPVQVKMRLSQAGHDPMRAQVRWVRVDGTGRPLGEEQVAPMRLENPGLKAFSGSFRAETLGNYVYTAEAWRDVYRGLAESLRKKADAGQEVYGELDQAAGYLEGAAERAAGVSKPDAKRLAQAAATLRAQMDEDRAGALAEAVDGALVELAGRYPEADTVGRHVWSPLIVDNPLASSGAWFEVFPRSEGPGLEHGTLRDLVPLLPDIAAAGFQAVYLPPIHPISVTARKGRNNAPVAGPDDPGSPWAIGGPEGGHTAIHPQLGTLEDFDALVEQMQAHGITPVMDVVFQAGRDHEDIAQHPEWFEWRKNPDGTEALVTAENPPKVYPDVANYRLDHPDPETRAAIWEHLRDIVLFWADRGIRAFRVDNPHTKHHAFFQWAMASVREKYPDAFFHAEAFADPTTQVALADAGFNQSVTHFPWFEHPWQFQQYYDRHLQNGDLETMRLFHWVTTPDILAKNLHGADAGRFDHRVRLAAYLSPTWGFQRGTEFAESTPMAGGKKEELADNDKYQINERPPPSESPLWSTVAHVNRLTREHPALQSQVPLISPERGYGSNNPHLLVFGKVSDDRQSQVLVVANLDLDQPQTGSVDFNWDDFGLVGQDAFPVENLDSEATETWRGGVPEQHLFPGEVRIWSIPRPGASSEAASVAE